MKLKEPFVITSRLLPGLHFRDVAGDLSEISIEHVGFTDDNRARFKYYFDTPGFEFAKDDLKSGGRCDIQEAVASLLSFLLAAVESYRYGGDNADLFPLQVLQWAKNHEYDLQVVQMDIEQAGLITAY